METIPQDMIDRAVEYFMVKRDAKLTFGTTWGVAQFLRAALDGYELGFELSERDKQVLAEARRCQAAGEPIGTGTAIYLVTLVGRAAQALSLLKLAPAEPQPDAPTDIAALPDFWDERRKKQGKPDLSRCAAELRVALEALPARISTKSLGQAFEEANDPLVNARERIAELESQVELLEENLSGEVERCAALEAQLAAAKQTRVITPEDAHEFARAYNAGLSDASRTTFLTTRICAALESLALPGGVEPLSAEEESVVRRAEEGDEVFTSEFVAIIRRRFPRPEPAPKPTVDELVAKLRSYSTQSAFLDVVDELARRAEGK